MWIYCTKEDVFDYSGIAIDNLKDSWSRLVEGMINEHTGDQYGSTTLYTEAYDGDGSDTLILKHSPLVSVTSLSISGVDMRGSGYKVYTSGYIRLVSTTGSSIDAALGHVGSAFPVGQQNITVVYTANESTVPSFVQLAAILCVSEMAMIKERAGADGSLAVSRASQRAGESGRSFVRTTDISGRLRAIIRNTIGQKWRFK